MSLLNWLPSPPVILSTRLSDWLLYPGSFMERLRDYGVKDAQISVLHQGWQTPFEEEQIKLNLSSAAFIREVLIHNDTVQFMYARTVFPEETLSGEEQNLIHLENRSLGSVLFNRKDLQRSIFDFIHLRPNMLWYQKAKQYASITTNELWARRSVFSFSEKKLLLTEVFLPDMEKLCV